METVTYGVLICMLNRLLILLLLVSVTGYAGSLLYILLEHSKPRYKNFTLTLPAEDFNRHYQFTTRHVKQITASNPNLCFTLNENKEENLKKLSIIRQGLLKIKYTDGAKTNVIIRFGREMGIRFLFLLLQICEEDIHKSYTLILDEFIIFSPLLTTKG